MKYSRDEWICESCQFYRADPECELPVEEPACGKQWCHLLNAELKNDGKEPPEECPVSQWAIGKHHNRIDSSPREKAFFQEWRREDLPMRGTSCGLGILQGLFVTYPPQLTMMEAYKLDMRVEARDRLVAATLIQWLGSNIGFSFLQNALNRCGYDIIKREKPA